MIPNHASATLSELDLRIARAVPPGGNWRNIPVDIPSDRLAQIRVSAAAGKVRARRTTGVYEATAQPTL